MQNYILQRLNGDGEPEDVYEFDGARWEENKTLVDNDPALQIAIKWAAGGVSGSIIYPTPEEEIEDIDDEDDDLPEVDVCASGYEWECPSCNAHNKNCELLDTYRCGNCGLQVRGNYQDCF